MQVTALVPVPIALFGLGKKPNREPCIIVVSLLKKKKEGKKKEFFKKPTQKQKCHKSQKKVSNGYSD